MENTLCTPSRLGTTDLFYSYKLSFVKKAHLLGGAAWWHAIDSY